MRRPLAWNRLRAAAVDRRIAAGSVSLAAVAVLIAAGVARAPQLEIDRRDAAAARDLLTLMRAGERGRWLVTYEFTRTLNSGRKLQQSMQEGRVPSLHVLVSGTSMTVEKPGRSFDCNLVGERAECSPGVAGRVLPASEVLRVALAAGAYGVARRPAEAIAGARARCFRVFRIGHGFLPDIGTESELCLAGDGILMRQHVVNGPGDVDERVARSVERRVATRAIEDVVRDFDPRRAE